jgi:hypothetical protein
VLDGWFRGFRLKYWDGEEMCWRDFVDSEDLVVKSIHCFDTIGIMGIIPCQFVAIKTYKVIVLPVAE